jgi:Heavy metal binding domain
MNVRRLPFATFVLAALLLSATDGLHATPIGQRGNLARQKTTGQVRYVCPMHADVESMSRGTCPKCKMNLVKKRRDSPRNHPNQHK